MLESLEIKIENFKSWKQSLFIKMHINLCFNFGIRSIKTLS